MMLLKKPSSADVVNTAWAYALTLPQFGYAEISAGLGMPQNRATDIVRGWAAAGLVEPVPPTVNKRKLFRVVAGARLPQLPRGRTAEENMWTAMRRQPVFTPTILAAHACVDEMSVSPEEAQAYCRSLLAAGYLRVVIKARPPRTEATYRLIRNTGRLPPVERRLRAIVDQNTEEVHFVHRAGL